MANPDVAMTLDEAVEEVLGLLTGLEVAYDPQYDRYRAIARTLNRALRANALEHEWSYYSSIENVGLAHAGDTDVALRSSIRLRKIGDDSAFDSGQARRPSPDTFAGKPVADMTDAQLQQFGRAAGTEGKVKIDAELTRRAFMGDQSMQGHKLGEMTPKGYKVLDANGLHIGYYRR